MKIIFLADDANLAACSALKRIGRYRAGMSRSAAVHESAGICDMITHRYLTRG